MRDALIRYNSNIDIYKTTIEAHISDIHFGVIDPKVQYDILHEQFVSRLALLGSKLDIISINGDLFDHKFMSNSDVVLYASMFIDELVSLCRMNDITLILIHGTNYHDAGQLKLFYHYTNDRTVDVRIVENVRFEYAKGKRILCIPELYGRNSVYYNSFLKCSGLYDSVYMHGTFKGSIYGKDTPTLDSDREPVFQIEDFYNCTGPIISGHVHIGQCFNNDFYYCGSPIRWCYGEEQPKGFLILTHNLNTREYYVHFEEIQSFRYDTINLDLMLLEDPKKVIEHVKLLQANGIDNIRIEFTVDSENIEIVRNFYKNNSNVNIKFDRKAVKEQKKHQEMIEKYKQFDFIMDKNLSEYDILSRYINQNLGYAFISSDDLIELLKE